MNEETLLVGGPKELISVVISDLEFLQKEWDQSVGDDSLRRSSNVLRMLLDQGNLGRAWRACGFEKEPRILAPDLKKAIDDLPMQSITFASAGGAEFKGTKIMNALMYNFVMTPEQEKKRFQQGPYAQMSTFYVSAFMQSLCLIVKGVEISRRVLIKYVANKLGGAHLDLTRDTVNDLEQKYMLLDKVGNGIIVADKNAVYYELLSMGQALTKSKDILKLIKKVKALV